MSDFLTPSNLKALNAPERTGPDPNAVKQPSAGKLQSDRPLHGSTSTERTGPDNHAVKHQSSSKLHSDLQ